MLHEEITRDIIGAAMMVLNELKPGLDEKLYERAMVIELLAQGHTIDQQRQYPVHYRQQHIGTLVPDLIVDSKVIVDPKGGDELHRKPHCTNVGLPEHYRLGGGATAEFQGSKA